MRPFIRYYYGTEGHFGSQAFLQPVPARSPSIIEFVFDTPYRIERLDCGGRMQGGFPVALVGPKTHRFVNLHLSGRVDAFTIAFQIGGLRALFGLPVEEITNQDPDAEAVLGRGIGQLRQRLGECSSFEDRARTADAFLAAMCPDFIKSSSAVAAARLIHHRRGAVRVDELAHRAGLSARQLERRFRHEIGIAPKH